MKRPPPFIVEETHQVEVYFEVNQVIADWQILYQATHTVYLEYKICHILTYLNLKSQETSETETVKIKRLTQQMAEKQIENKLTWFYFAEAGILTSKMHSHFRQS